MVEIIKMKTKIDSATQVNYHLDPKGCFVIENYNRAKPFTNFFPGVAGLWGIPMWVFYVNRGQSISSFGIEGKDKAILEFQPANKAYRLTSLEGFRTFLKIHLGSRQYHWEPFQDDCYHLTFKTKQQMFITSHDLTLEEINPVLGLKIQANYFTMPQESFPALVRRLTIQNLSKKKYRLEVMDGLPVIIPSGMTDWLMKNMSRTAEAWIKVNNLKNKAPFFHLNVVVSDTPSVMHILEGNFYFVFDPSSSSKKLLDVIVDPSGVFGAATHLINPQRFFENRNFKIPVSQKTTNRTPCAFGYGQFDLPAKGKKEIISLFGHANHEKELNLIVKKVLGSGFIEHKAKQNFELIASIKNHTFTNSSSLAFNHYCSQNFLDNVLRGGYPISWKTENGNITFNVYSRKHGDPERDYNHFILSPTYFSQGNGNYRDVNQNRRNDVWFNRHVKDSMIINFLSFCQADGYNPLIIKGASFSLDSLKMESILKTCVNGKQDALKERLNKPFQPGELLKFISQDGVALKVSQKEFLSQVLGDCHKQELADHGEGFWTDHWTYNFDLIESFLSLYPEELKSLLLEKKAFHFYLNSHYILPREERYILTPKGVRQYHSVKNDPHDIKAEERGFTLRVDQGQGEVYQTTLLVKILCLIANKASTFDPSGIGIEMEADRPNWYDALNGLPGLLGSSLSETLELKRFCRFLQNAFAQLDLKDHETVMIFEELFNFIRELKLVLKDGLDPWDYWQKANEIKEHYRLLIRKGTDGIEQGISFKEIKEFLNLIIEKTDSAYQKAKVGRALIATYFYHEVTEYSLLNKKFKGLPLVCPKKFKRHTLPLFLEGFVHALRVEEDVNRARKLYLGIKKSPLYDKKLRMFKVNTDLSKESEEIGRTRIFPTGWLENESIWLHMEYKFFLELLKRELYEEFFEALPDIFIPFLKPEIYGRSILENSSFLVSSAHEDASLHGQGFVARLSGSTAEFLHMWLIMNMGHRPFILDSQNKLCLALKPILPHWLFTTKATQVDYWDTHHTLKRITLPKDSYAFNLLGSILTVYHNPQRRNTFGKNASQIKEILLTYPGRNKSVKIAGGIIRGSLALDIRDQKVDRIDVFFE